MSEFDQLCESMGILKKTTRERYPREIKLSEEFLEALKKEYYNHKLEEDASKPVRNRPAKFGKALRFHISHLENTAAVELEAMKAKFDAEADTGVAVEQNDERVPEVKVDGKKLELPQNDAPKNKEPKEEKLCKCKRLVLKRNTSMAPVETEVKEAYGTKKDHPKQDIYVGGKYVASTNWAKSGKQAKEEYLKKNSKVDPKSVKVTKGK